MIELVAIAPLVPIIVVITALFLRAVDRDEQRWVWLGLISHLFGAIAKVLIVYYWYGDGDMTSYIKWGAIMADFIRSAPEQWAGPYLQFGLHNNEIALPYDPPGSGGATGTMFALAAFYQVIFPGAKFGISLTTAVFSFSSKMAIYIVFREVLPPEYRRRLAYAMFLIPSAVYWSGGFGKEGVAFMTAGWIVWGYYQAFHKGRWVTGLAVAVAAAAWVALIKPYIVFPMVIAFAAWEYGRRNIGRAFNPLRMLAIGVVAGVFVVGALGLLGSLFPRYALENLAESSEELQVQGVRTGSGSMYSAHVGSGPAGLVASAPLALFAAFYRPLLFEARNPMMLMSALETTTLLLLSLYIVRERRLGILEVLQRNPALLFCATYALLFGFATGYASTNLGTLSRYRMPMLPYVGILFAALTPIRATAAAQLRRRPLQRTPSRVVAIPGSTEAAAVSAAVSAADRERAEAAARRERRRRRLEGVAPSG